MSTEKDSNLYTIMHARKSVRVYDPNFKVSQHALEEIIKEATSAPSSSNLQAWKFLVIQDDKTKVELRAIANNQEQVETSSAVIAVLGNAEMYKNVEQIYTQNVAEGYMDEATKDLMINNTNRTYPFASLETRKNIATFDAGLIAMQLMLVAKEKGLDTVTMGGFDKVKFAERFQLPEHIFPIVLIAIGKAAAPAYGSSRLPLSEIVQFT
ncbi:nitroreductase family protein [Psychrobacillus sp. NEAU-3TGS]|uniref:nitroreductase family protein n=1 Tax=Psychrobacillus sp. NEAU-3TGS TaxID=2995412 RepID=UPI002496AFB1|nr:nitroreductase family protein [Psychrobacillus sp. NEAU-3TGS]MDI2585895.1 nitroreductase family protein [Psychrobacillus sp. NEAU-3TGS]